MTQDLIVEQDGNILRVTLNRPAQGNGVTDEMARQLSAVLTGAHATSDVVVLEGAGTDFCTGRARNPGAPAPSMEAYARRDEYDVIFDCYWAVRRSAVPVICAVQGRAMGFGTAIAALCDVSIADSAATFSIPEMGHNILPTMVLSALFDRVTRNAISWMAYSTDAITAERAMMYGLVSTMVPSGQLKRQVEGLCTKLLKTPRPALRGLKEYLRVAPTMDAQGAIDYARSLHAMVNTSSAMTRKPA